jgi:hypothetical protein
MANHSTNPLPTQDAGPGTSLPTNVRADGILDAATPPAQTISDARSDGVGQPERASVADRSRRGTSWLMTALLLAAAAAAVVWSFARNVEPTAPRLAPHGDMSPDRTPGRPAP